MPQELTDEEIDNILAAQGVQVRAGQLYVLQRLRVGAVCLAPQPLLQLLQLHVVMQAVPEEVEGEEVEAEDFGGGDDGCAPLRYTVHSTLRR